MISAPQADRRCTPPHPFTDEEREQATLWETPLKDYVTQKTLQVHPRPAATSSEWDAYVAELKAKNTDAVHRPGQQGVRAVQEGATADRSWPGRVRDRWRSRDRDARRQFGDGTAVPGRRAGLHACSWSSCCSCSPRARPGAAGRCWTATPATCRWSRAVRAAGRPGAVGRAVRAAPPPRRPHRPAPRRPRSGAATGPTCAAALLVWAAVAGVADRRRGEPGQLRRRRRARVVGGAAGASSRSAVDAVGGSTRW